MTNNYWRAILKKAGKTNSDIELFMNNIEDQIREWKRFSSTHIEFSVGLFKFIYPSNATTEQKEKLIIKALKKHQTKEYLADLKIKAKA